MARFFAHQKKEQGLSIFFFACLMLLFFCHHRSFALETVSHIARRDVPTPLYAMASHRATTHASKEANAQVMRSQSMQTPLYRLKKWLMNHPERVSALQDMQKQAFEQGVIPDRCELTAGHILPHTTHIPAGRGAFFVLDGSPFSKRWLVRHLTPLKKMHATGFLINATSADKAVLIHSTHSHLPLTLAGCQGLGEIFKVTHVPFVVAKGRVFA